MRSVCPGWSSPTPFNPDGITSACNGQVWRVDVGMSAHYGGQEAGLEILGDYVQPIELD